MQSRKSVRFSLSIDKITFLAILLFPLAIRLSGQGLKVTQLVSNHAVIQQGQPIRVWGTDSPGNTVACSVAQISASTTVSADGDWFVELDNGMTLGQNYTMTIQSESGMLNFEGLVAGDVWLASGQSNMAWTFANIEGDPNGNPRGYGALPDNMQEVKSDNLPDLRMMSVQFSKSSEEKPLLNAVGNPAKNSWRQMTSYEGLIEVQSAVGYYFGRTLHKKLDYPIGIVVSAVGGSYIEQWLTQEAEDTLVTMGVDLSDNQFAEQNRERGEFFNGMIAPLIPLPISGVVWYQGEANTVNTAEYAEKTLVCFNSWQDRWDQKFPIYTTTLAGLQWNATRDTRNEQLLAALSNDFIYATSAFDLGVIDNIHPDKKKEVGERHAALALHHIDSQAYEKPLYPRISATNISDDSNQIDLIIEQADGLLETYGSEELTSGMFRTYEGEMEITNRAWFIADDSIRVQTDSGTDPDRVEYNYVGYTENHILLDGLPMHGYTSAFDYTPLFGMSSAPVDDPVTVLEVERADKQFANIYPNPARDTLTLEFPSKAERIIQIVDLNGQVLYKESSGQKRIELNVSEIVTQNAVVVRITSGSEIRSFKVLLQR